MKKSALLALSLMAANASAAMILGFGVEADYLAPAATGDFKYNNTAIAFNGTTERGYQIGAYLEHPIPLVPNLRLDYTSDVTFSGSNNNVSLNQLDVTPYYEILDNIVDLDIGVTAKTISGKTKGNTEETFNAVIPMGYVGAAVMVPGTGFNVEGSVKYISFSGDSFTDARIKAALDIVAGLQVHAGYRYEALKLDNRFDIKADANFKGPFVGLGYTF
ncbi:MAG: TIGR04219 family outer membrane beta-barrel protein [Campylobacterales bacterium]|nr:TIGR04219 family outer membrane beta-barrel protein [Campylobacterales bacterium]